VTPRERAWDLFVWPPNVETWVVGGALLLDLLALVTIWTGPKHSRKSKTLWTVIVLLLPVLGAIGWFLLGQERRRRRRN
jgi:hypothetical protein